MELDLSNLNQDQSILSNTRPNLIADEGPKSKVPVYLKPENNGGKEDSQTQKQIAFVAQIGMESFSDT